MSLGTLYLASGMALIVIGMASCLLRRNLLRMVLGFAILDSGVHLFIAAMGFLPGRTAPIVDEAYMFSDAARMTVDASRFVDPVPQALVLTAIVIGVGVTALMLAYVVRLYAREGTLDVRAFRRLRW
jgi:multicomponent Na+:H+ antiporter subunit C